LFFKNYLRVSKILPKNLISVPVVPEITKTSFDSRTNFPTSKFAVSLDSIAKSFKISVVTATPATVLSWEKETLCVVDPTFAHCANNTTPVYPTGAV
tara:strand:- start:313 stop:603 length:291 start_codon:yes stop_codon:yes gene_type:complete